MPNLETSSLISRSTVTSREIFYSMTVDWAIPCHCHKTNLYLQSDALKYLQSSPITFWSCLKVALDCNFDHVITATGNKWSSVGGRTQAQDICVFGRLLDGLVGDILLNWDKSSVSVFGAIAVVARSLSGGETCVWP